MWTYTYETVDLDTLNWIIQEDSPSVDVDGDDEVDGAIALKQLTYYPFADLAVNGDMEVDDDWTPVGSPTTNQQSSTQAYEGTYSRWVKGDTDEGIEGKSFDLEAGRTYTIRARVYPDSGGVEMCVSGLTATFPTSVGNDAWEELVLTLEPDTASTGHKLQFLATADTSEFYVDAVTIEAAQQITQERGKHSSDLDYLATTDYVFQPGGENITTETTASKETTHYFADGVYAGPSDPAGNYQSQGLDTNYRPIAQADANGNATNLSWSSDGKLLDDVTDMEGNTTRFEYDSSDRLITSTDAEGRVTLYLYEGSERQPVGIRVTDGSNLVTNGDMEVDGDWTDIVGAVPSVNEQTSIAYKGSFSRHVDTNTAGQGIESVGMALTQDVTYQIQAYVRPKSGQVKMQLDTTTSVAELSATDSDTWGFLSASYTPTANETRKLQFVATDADDEFYVDAVIVTTGGNRITNGDMELDSNWTGITGSETTNARDANAYVGDYARYVVTTAANQGIESDGIALTQDVTYHILAHVRPVTGQVKMKFDSITAVSELSATGSDTWEFLSASYTPTANETRKLQFVATGVGDEFYVDAVYVLDKFTLLRWQEFVYDSKGRTLEEKLINILDGTSELQKTLRTFGTTVNENGLLKTIVQKNVDAAGVDETTTTYTYDAQGRVIKTGKSSLMGTCQYTYTVYDNAGHVLGSACGLYNDTTPPTVIEGAGGLLELYNVSDETKKHTRITTHTYDKIGRRVTTTVNDATTFARTSRTLYDSLSRVVRTINNYVVQGASKPGAWVWNATRWEYSDSDTTAVSHGTNDDENIISDTDYNERGLVYRRRDVLGRVTLYGYDLADHLVKTVQNALSPDYNASYTDGDPDLSRYVVDSSVEDGDVITEQSYDANGNLVKTIDARGSVSYTVYDVLNRPTRTVQNAKAAATIDLNAGDVGYAVSNDPRVLGSSGYEPSTAPDEDIISETTYDKMGRVVTSRRLLENRDTSIDPIWDENYVVYDELGRQKFTVQHYVAANPEVTPDNWVYESGQWKDGVGGTAINHGTNDQNIIASETIYDETGRVKETVDINQRVTRFVYDGLNRQVMTIGNYIEQGSPVVEPDNWVYESGQWKDGTGGTTINHGTNFDQNIISHTDYDGDGRVLETRNVEGLVQRNAYDTAGRSYLSVSNYVAATPEVTPDNWLWVSTQWEDGSSLAIARGTGYVQNIISKPDYDDESRVFQTRDARGNLTRQVYDDAGRRFMTVSNYVAQATEPETWVYESGVWKDGPSGLAIDFGTNKDQNRISHTTYDILGRVISTRDAVGRESYTVYDTLGRRSLTVANYVAQANLPEEWEWANNRWEDGSGTAIIHGAKFDQNIISQTIYNRSGQVLSTRDARGTETAFSYDSSGRRVMVTAAANTGQRARSYTCYDKAGRVLRTIQGYQPDGTDPDTWDGSANWDFAPATNGYHSDDNRITEHEYDTASRRVKTTNPTGDIVQTAYFIDGQVDSVTDPTNIVTVYRYDNLNRRKVVVQNYVSNGEDPSLWVWDVSQYEESDTTVIIHGTDKDKNIIVQVTYDIAGRMTQMRDPRGNATLYEYDVLGRRTKLTNALPQSWETAYTEVNQAQRTTLTYPNNPSAGVVRDFDRMGRLQQIDYGETVTPYTTPKVNFTYDILGRRENMTENDGTDDIRITDYEYDAANRLNKVEFDNDGNDTVDDTVTYEYDAGGRKTKLVINPATDNLAITYTYDQKGRLIRLSDWDANETSFTYDKADRHVRTRRSNGLDSLYQHDAAGRLRTLHHLKGRASLRQTFNYTVNALGNRTQAQEVTPRTTGATIGDMTHTYPALVYRGDWNDVGLYHEATVHDASLSILFYGETATLKMGVGSDYSLFDVYIDGTLWLSFDGYAATEGDLAQIDISVEGTGLHLLEVKNRLEHNVKSTGYKIRFKLLNAQPAFDVSKIDYGYDDISRLLEADTDTGTTIYTYGYDLAGNLVNNNGTIRTYNAANQMSNDGTNTLTYDDNGNLTNDGVNSFTWDRANRMLTAPSSTSYAYDGLGNRVQQTVSSVVTNYLNDVQPGLTKLLRQADGTNTDHFIHAPRGIHAVDDGTDWTWHTQDGLGSVRGLIDASADVVSSQSYNPYGVPDGSYGAGFGFTGEQTDVNEQLYLRARYYSPEMGIFSALDPFEGRIRDTLSLNRYSYVMGNVMNKVDPSGLECTVPYNELGAGIWDEETGEYVGSNPNSAPARNEACQNLYEILYTSLSAPTWEEVFYCYNCAMDNTALPTPETYRQGLEQAVRDGMATRERVEMAISQYERSYRIPLSDLDYDPTSLIRTGLLDGNGYLEGQGLGGGFFIFGGQVGREIVYNFATFERAHFYYVGGGGNLLTGDDLNLKVGGEYTNYVGYIANFAPQNRCSSSPFQNFEMQYEGAFEVYSGSYSIGIGLGVSHFQTPFEAQSAYPVRGQSTSILLGAGLSLGYSRLNYTRYGTGKSYISDIDGRVDINELQADIRNGTDSVLSSRYLPDVVTEIFLPIYQTYLRGSREEAAKAANELALIYNNSNIARPCSDSMSLNIMRTTIGNVPC